MSGQRMQLNFSGLQLITHAVPDTGWYFDVLKNGFRLGSATSEREVRESLQLDGDDSVIDHYGNREISFEVRVYAYGGNLAMGEREIRQRIGGLGSLILTPPDRGADSLYIVRTSTMERVDDEDNALGLLRDTIKDQTWKVTLDCAPWAYATETVEEVFAPGAGTIVEEQNGTSAADWPGMSTGTYLSQSVVTLGPLTAQTTGSWAIPSWLVGYVEQYRSWLYSESSSITGNPRCTEVMPVANYIYADIAIETTAITVPGLGFTGTLFLKDTPFGAPSGSMPTPSKPGFTRYIWQMPTTRLFNLSVYMGARAGDTMSVHIDSIGTSTTIPSGSMFGLAMLGSVRVPAQLKVSHPSPASNSLGEVMVYADPTMMQYGWDPGNGATWPLAPEGYYWLYVQPSVAAYTSGTKFGATVAGVTKTTVTKWIGDTPSTDARWFPIGPFFLGATRSRRVGSPSGLGDAMTLTQNGTPMGGTSPVRLIRAHKDATLLQAVELLTDGSTERSRVFVDPATFDQPRPGVFAGEAADGSDAVSWLNPETQLPVWGWPTLLPGFTSLWVKCRTTDSPQVTVTHRPAFGDYVTEIA